MKIKEKFELLKYRLKYNDVELKRKIKVLTIFFVILISIPLLYFFKPFTNLRNLLILKSERYISQGNKKYYIVNDKTNTDTNNNISLVDASLIPISGTITSGYGMRSYPYYGKHTGIDISGIHHDNVRSIKDGTVTFAGSQTGYGYCIEIRHDNFYSFYAHLSQIKVNVGDNVVKGQVIGIEGGDPYSDPNPGYSTGHHLHFEIRRASGYGNDVDPTSYLWK